MIFDIIQLAYLNTIDNMNMLLRQCLQDVLSCSSFSFRDQSAPLYHIVLVCCFDFCISKHVVLNT